MIRDLLILKNKTMQDKAPKAQSMAALKTGARTKNRY